MLHTTSKAEWAQQAEASSPPPPLRQRLAARAAQKALQVGRGVGRQEGKLNAQQKLSFAERQAVATPCRRLEESVADSPEVRPQEATRREEALAEIERLLPLRKQRWTPWKARQVLRLAEDAKDGREVTISLRALGQLRSGV